MAYLCKHGGFARIFKYVTPRVRLKTGAAKSKVKTHPVRAEFFALPLRPRDNQYLALSAASLDLTNKFRNRSPNRFRMIFLQKVDACTELHQPAVMELMSEAFSHGG